MISLKRIVLSLTAVFIVLGGLASSAADDTNFHKGQYYKEVIAGVDSEMKNEHTRFLIKRYKMSQKIEEQVYKNFDGIGKKTKPAYTLTIYITDFRFRTGRMFGAGLASRDILKAEVLVEGPLDSSKKFTVSAALAKGMGSRLRVRMLIEELSAQIVASL